MGEVVAVPDVESVSWIYYVIGVWGAAIITWIGGIANKYVMNLISSRTQDALLLEAYKCIASGVSETYNVYVKSLKDANADGKLTKEEAAEARELAWKYALEFGSTRGVDVAKIIGKNYAGVLIEYIIGSLKNRSAPLVS